MRDQHHKNICKYCLYIYIYYIYACMCMYVRMLAYMFCFIHDTCICMYVYGGSITVFRVLMCHDASTLGEYGTGTYRTHRFTVYEIQ